MQTISIKTPQLEQPVIFLGKTNNAATKRIKVSWDSDYFSNVVKIKVKHMVAKRIKDIYMKLMSDSWQGQRTYSKSWKIQLWKFALKYFVSIQSRKVSVISCNVTNINTNNLGVYLSSVKRNRTTHGIGIKSCDNW